MSNYKGFRMLLEFQEWLAEQDYYDMGESDVNIKILRERVNKIISEIELDEK